MINIDEELQKAEEDMNGAEDALLKIGFPEEQWELIRQYIASAIIHSQWSYAKACQSLPEIGISS